MHKIIAEIGPSATICPIPYSLPVHAKKQDLAQGNWIERLCPECGLCCNGVLFADVRLVKGDNSLLLEELGLNLKRIRGKPAFDQPCACFDGRLCTAYEHRPSRCRAFDCHTLKQARAGDVTSTTALGRIREARRQADEIRSLLRSLGNQDESLPLTKRYQAVMSQPIDLADPGQADQRGELMMAVNTFMNRLHRDFLQ